MEQKAYSFDKLTVIKIGRGAIIALTPVLCLYLLDILPQLDFGVYSSFVTAIGSIILNTIYQWAKGKEVVK